MVDCADDFDNHGCNGGLPSHAFEYLHYSGGIMTSADYPYEAKDNKCRFDRQKIAMGNIQGSFNITANDETELTNAIYTKGPVSIAFQVVNDFMSYRSGVYSSSKCKNSATDVNHAVLAVGYGVENGEEYYLVKNSWGSSWGDKGYFKIKRNKNMCGVA